MKEKISALIAAFGRQKVLVVGDAILDIYTRGATDNICREAPVLILTIKEHAHHCGGAANTAINLAALGAEAYLLAVTGKDAHGDRMINVLKRNGVHTEHVVRDRTRVTIAKQRLMASTSILLRVDEGTIADIPAPAEAILLEKFRALYPQMDAIIFSDYQYGTFTDGLIRQLGPICSKTSRPLVVDAKDPSRFKSLRPAVIKPNYAEALRLLGVRTEEGDLRIAQIMEHGPRIQELTQARRVVVTLDTGGAILFEKDKTPYHIPAIMQDNTRAIGAGDTFTAAAALALACHAPGRVMLQLATAAAAVVVKKSGTAVCTQGELRGCFATAAKYLEDVKQLQKMVKDMKGQGKKIVFTNGCFDILHKGHIAMLQKARQEGDVLIVGLNTDESIGKLKGPGRPINTLQDRISVLSGLQSVDFIVPFAETSPVNLLRALQPHVFVKGATYSEQSIPELALLKKLNCAVKIIPYAGGHSTSRIIRKILRIRKAAPSE